MIRLTLYITLAILFALGAVWLADHPGELLVRWQGWEIRMSMAVFSLVALAYTLGCWVLFKLYRWFRTDNPLKSPKRRESRRQKGLREMDLGWSALAVQDRTSAVRHGKKAQSFLPEDTAPLRLLLAASAQKDKEQYRKKLATIPEARLTAMTAALADNHAQGHEDKALEILTEMQEICPKNTWIAHQTFEMLARKGHWVKARTALISLAKTKVLDAGTQKNLTAIICYRQAIEADLSGQKITARDFAREALKQDPGLSPAACFLAQYYMSHEDKSSARKLLENTWKNTPHPDLARLFLDLEPLESPSEKFRRCQKFTALNPDHPHSRHMLAQVALDTEHWQEAKQTLETLVQNQGATAKTYQLLARLERLQKQDDAAAEAFLATAAQAPADPVWHCQACDTTSQKFQATCPQCGQFGQIHWH